MQIKVELREFGVWNESVFIQIAAEMLHRLRLVSHTLWILKKNMSFAVRILSCPVMWWLAEAAQDTVTQGSVTAENDLIIIVVHLYIRASNVLCCMISKLYILWSMRLLKKKSTRQLHTRIWVLSGQGVKGSLLSNVLMISLEAGWRCEWSRAACSLLGGN